MKTRHTQILELRRDRLIARINHKPVKPIDKKLQAKVCRQLKFEMKMERMAS
jgi:hypothetical protein